MRGTVIGDTVTIHALTPIPHADATPDKVEFYHDDAIAPNGARDSFIGSLHSHPGPDVDGAPSVADWKSAFECGEIVSGIMTLVPGANGRFRSSFYFWPTRPLCAVVHPRVRAPRKRKNTPTSIPSDAIDVSVSNPVQSDSTPNDKA
jgi:proteasome lid subunit RPN8/RPN11